MDLPQDLFRIALRCKSVSRTLEDYELLAALLSYLSPKDDANSFRDSIFDKKSEKPADISMLCLASQRCDNVWTAREGIDWLLFYIFYRRYGWDDGGSQRNKVQVFCPSMLERVRWTTREEELKFKERIVAVSMDLINWYESQPLKLATLKLFNSAIRVARCSPMTRHHMAIHAIRWLTLQLEAASSASPGVRTPVATASPFLPSDATPETMYLAVKDLMLLSMANSIYATRTAVIPLMSRLLLQLSLCSITRLLDQIIEMFNRQEVKRWEEAEGLLNALGLLIKRALPLPSPSEETSSNAVVSGPPGAATTMSLETYETQILPQIKLLVFNLFDHDHPSVRIGAVHLYITCLKRCPHQLIEKALDEIMNEVCVNRESDPVTLVEDMGPALSAHATESLLSLCQSLLKYYFIYTDRAGGVKLPPSTGDLQNNLTQTYLGDPDPNVRMAACQVYETLIISALDNLNRVRYLLKKILENWPIRQEILLSPLQMTATIMNGGRGSVPSQVMVPEQLATWREGRLMIFERVCQKLIQRHYAVLYNVLVRIPDGELSTTIVEDYVNVDGHRLYSHGNMPGRSSTGQSKRPQYAELYGSADPRANSPTDEAPMPSAPRRSSIIPPLDSILPHSKTSTHFRLWGLGHRKNSEASISILDRLRKSDEQEKTKRQEATRASVWKSEFAKRFSVVALKTTTYKTQSLGGQPEVETMNMSSIFSQVLHLSAECLISEPRELRQCGRTTFSEVIRFLRWYNTDVISEFLSNNLIFKPTLMTYVALKILRSSIDEFVLYDRLVFCNEEFGPLEISGGNSPDARSKTSQIVELFPNGYFLNVPLIRALFSIDRSSSWLRTCQHYLTDEAIPTFITLPALRCMLTTLSLVHLLPKFVQAARYTESLKPSLGGEKSETINLSVDAESLVEGVRAMTSYIRRFEVVLDERGRPSTITGEHLKIGSLRPFNLRFNEMDNIMSGRRPKHDILIPFLSYIINEMELVLFRFIPPMPNPSKPDPLTRRNAGLMLAPMLSQLLTWPLALLPVGTVDSPSVSHAGREKKLLAVRKLLRIVASIVHAIPITEASSSKALDKSEDKSSLPAQLDAIVSGRVDLTGTVNTYFTQLERMMTDLSRAWAPTPLCQSASWWWFRALCEHMPRMLQISPHANPVSLIRHLLDATGKLSRSAKPSKQAPRLLSRRRILQLWSKAIAYAKIEARKTLATKKKGFGYRWPTVGELLKSVGSSRTESTGSESRSVSEKKRSDGSDETESVFESHFDTAAAMSYKNPAFDYMTDEEEGLVLEPAEPDSSSSEELEMTERKPSRGRISLSRQTRRRRLTSSTSEPKAQAIETPPPLTDIVDLVKRVWRFCQPVTVGTLKNLLSGTELSLITEEMDSATKMSLQSQQQQRRLSQGRLPGRFA